MLFSRFNYRISLYLFIATISSFLISLFLLQLFAGLLVLVYLMEPVKSKKLVFDNIFYLFFAFVLIRILAALLSEYPGSSNQVFYKDALFFLSFFAFAFYLKTFNGKNIKTVSDFFVLAGIVVAIIGLTLFMLNKVSRAESFTSGYSTFSSYLLVVFSFGIIVFKNLSRENVKTLMAVGLALILAGIITSMGRTNIAIAAVIFIAGIFIAKIRIKYILIIVILTSAISWTAFNINYTEVNLRIKQPAALSDRDILLNAAEELFFEFEHPLLGYGPRTFNDVFTYREQLTDKGAGSWHNDFIQVYFESGMLGLLSFLLIIFYPISAALIFIRKKKVKGSNLYLLCGAVLGEFALVLSALTAGFVNSPVLSVLFAFLIAFISAIVFPVDRKELSK